MLIKCRGSDQTDQKEVGYTYSKSPVFPSFDSSISIAVCSFSNCLYLREQLTLPTEHRAVLIASTQFKNEEGPQKTRTRLVLTNDLSRKNPRAQTSCATDAVAVANNVVGRPDSRYANSGTRKNQGRARGKHKDWVGTYERS
jgi:hypothetical protein